MTTNEAMFRVEWKLASGFSGALAFTNRAAAEAMIFALRHMPAENRAVSVHGYGWADSRPVLPDLLPACKDGIWTDPPTGDETGWIFCGRYNGRIVPLRECAEIGESGKHAAYYRPSAFVEGVAFGVAHRWLEERKGWVLRPIPGEEPEVLICF